MAVVESASEPELDESESLEVCDRQPFTEWSLQFQPGAEFFVPEFVGPSLRIAGWAERWNARFVFGGGPYVQYGAVVVSQDPAGLLTAGGDFLAGGGRHGKYAVFFHATFGAGLNHLVEQNDGPPSTEFAVGLRGGIGFGGLGWVSDRLTIGGLVNIGFAGRLTRGSTFLFPRVDVYLAFGVQL